MKKILLICMVAVAVMSACRGGHAFDPANLGTYAGTLPCADCEGIMTELTINGDDTYVHKTSYLGKGDSLQFITEGKYRWDEKAGSITLEGLAAPNVYKVDDNKLTQLDIEGNVIAGELADKYILTKRE